MVPQAQGTCRPHTWQRTRTPGIFVCSVCQATRREQIAQHTIREMKFTEEQALQRQRSPQPQNIPPRVVPHPEEIDLDSQGMRVAEEPKQGKRYIEEPPKRKSKWPDTPADWISLLATPLTILSAVGGLLWSVIQFNAQQSASAAQALDQEHQTTFDTYLDRMSDLLLIDHLQTVKPGSPVRAIAQARTTTALRALDSFRRAELVRFLWKAGLVTGKQPVISLNAAPLSSTMFQHALLMRINLSGALLISSTFYDCDLQGASFIAATLPGATLNIVNLTSANMTQANLYGATLKDVTLTGANMTQALLRRANLSGDDLTKVNLTGANMIQANLQRANLSGDDLTKVNLTGANLAGANLKGAKITPAQLKQIASLQGAILPDGSKHP